MAIVVTRESENTKSRYVSPAYIDKDGVSYTTSSDRPFPMIDVNHLRLHEGRAYYVYKQYPYNAKLNAAASIDIVLYWPALTYAHSLFTYSSSGEAEFYVYENPVITGGTAMTIHRRNRYLTAVSSATATLDPTINNVGTEIYAEFVPANNQGGGSEGYTFEYVLKPETNYLFRFTNVNSQAHPAILRVEWYE